MLAVCLQSVLMLDDSFGPCCNSLFHHIQARQPVVV